MDLRSLLYGKYMARLRVEDRASSPLCRRNRGEEPSPPLGFYGAASSAFFSFVVCTCICAPSLCWQCLLRLTLLVALLCVVCVALGCLLFVAV